MRWTEINEDPNHSDVIAWRKAELDAAKADLVGRFRVEFIVEAASGKKVLDIGVVEHFVGAMDRGNWLHGQIVEVASSVLGTDVDPTGVAYLRERGFDVVVHDVSEGSGPLKERGPFDLIVAGEIIEHLDAPIDLLHLARELLLPGGRLLITTPNPYAPHRSRSGVLGITWENVDHLTYIFPSGMAEMASRTGFRILQFGSVNPNAKTWSEAAGMLRDTVRHFLRRNRPAYTTEPFPITPLDFAERIIRPLRMTGETAIYVLERVRDEGAIVETRRGSVPE